jgi:hypothetical protein
MATGWLTVLKSVLWADVIGNAPKAPDRTRKLWNTVGKRPPALGQAAASPHPVPASGAQAIAVLQARLAALESAASDLHEQMLASSELIKALADQNAQLVKGIEANRIRAGWLLGFRTWGVKGPSSIAS